MNDKNLTVRNFIQGEDFLKKLTRIAPKSLNIRRLIVIVLSEIKKKPMLAFCDPYEVGGAIFQAAQLGLEIGSALDHASLIPYGKDKQKPVCVLRVTHKGLISVACRYGSVSMMDGQTVYENDSFGFNYGDHSLSHSYDLRASRGEIIGAYAQAFLKDGQKKIKVMSVEEINAKSRSVSSQYKNAETYGREDSFWHTHYDAMACKTPIRHIIKQIGTSTEEGMALDIDTAGEMGLQNNRQRFAEIAEVNESELLPPESFLTPSQDELNNLLDKKAA